MQDERDHADVVAFPPLIYLTAFVLGLLLKFFLPPPISLPRAVNLIAGILLIIAAGAIAFAAFRQMARAQTNVNPSEPTHSIVTDGVFGFSRNPIYLSLTMLFSGANLLLDNLWGLFLLVPLVFIVQTGVVLREEKYLERKFGDQYLDYKKRVRRWI